MLPVAQGENWSLVEVSNARGTFAALQENRVNFFELQEGQLVPTSTTTLSSADASQILLLHVSNKQIFVKRAFFEKVNVYSHQRIAAND
jgi:hypothetical protein